MNYDATVVRFHADSASASDAGRDLDVSGRECAAQLGMRSPATSRIATSVDAAGDAETRRSHVAVAIVQTKPDKAATLRTCATLGRRSPTLPATSELDRVSRSGIDRIFSRGRRLRSGACAPTTSQTSSRELGASARGDDRGRHRCRFLRERRRDVLQLGALSAGRRPSGSASCTSTARCSCRRTASSTRSAFSRAGEKSERSRRASAEWRMLICEDAWHAIVPTIAAVKGARILFVPSASPGRGIDGDGELASIARWRQILRAIAVEHGVYVSMPASPASKAERA